MFQVSISVKSSCPGIAKSAASGGHNVATEQNIIGTIHGKG
jgi:hypothetical protein